MIEEVNPSSVSLAEVGVLSLGAGNLANEISRHAAESDLAGSWSVENQRQCADKPWILVEHIRSVSRDQGWKLHISAAVPTAVHVLARALPILFRQELAFKVAASLEALAYLNEGYAGLSQIGKFITVYPKDDVQARELAAALDCALRGIRGPQILSDAVYCAGSLVHFRYGAFRGRVMRTAIGEYIPAMLSPTADLVPDVRSASFSPPSWAPQFLKNAEHCPSHMVFENRFVTLYTISESARGRIDAAIDVQEIKLCLIKHARRDAFLGFDGLDATDALQNEFITLKSLSGDPRVPKVYQLFQRNGDAYLAMEHFDGETLESNIYSRAVRGDHFGSSEITRLAMSLAEFLHDLHSRGILHRDIKPANIIVDPTGNYKVIDFESSYGALGNECLHGFGTIGYRSKSQAARQPPTVLDDIFGLGALLYMAATVTTVETGESPNVELYNPDLSVNLVSIIYRCVGKEGYVQFTCASEIIAALTSPPSIMSSCSKVQPAGNSFNWAAIANRAAVAICHAAQPTGIEGETCWASKHESNNGFPSDDINAGNAGTVLALAEYAFHFREARMVSALAAGARNLVRKLRSGLGGELPGLYVGKAGVGAALLRASQALGDQGLLSCAMDIGEVVALAPHTSPDIFNGTAGRLRFHVLLWDETGNRGCLDAAVEAGEFLLRSAVRDGGGSVWVAPEGYGSLSGVPYCGYAHGAGTPMSFEVD